MYKLKGQAKQALVHKQIEPSELWHQRLVHVHYIVLLMESKEVSGIPDIQEKNEGICKRCAQGKNAKKTFLNSESKVKEYWR